MLQEWPQRAKLAGDMRALVCKRLHVTVVSEGRDLVRTFYGVIHRDQPTERCEVLISRGFTCVRSNVAAGTKRPYSTSAAVEGECSAKLHEVPAVAASLLLLEPHAMMHEAHAWRREVKRRRSNRP